MKFRALHSAARVLAVNLLKMREPLKRQMKQQRRHYSADEKAKISLEAIGWH
jgi:hypothetical protein